MDPHYGNYFSNKGIQMIETKNNKTILERLFRNPKTNKERFAVIILLVSLVIIFSIQKVIFKVDKQNQSEMLNILQNLNSSKIESIEIYKLLGSKSEKFLLKTIDSRDRILTFTDSLKDISDWSPNHPVVKQSFALNINKSSKDIISLRCVILDTNDEIIYLYLNGNKTFTFQSQSFLKWCKEEEILPNN